jgi:hypothetical protein
LDLSKIILIGVAFAVVLILSSRNLGSFWTMIYKLVVGAIASGICLVVMQKVDTTDEVKWVTSIIVGLFVSIAVTGIPWR